MRRLAVLLPVIVVVVVLSLAACGDDEESVPPPADSPTEAAATPLATASPETVPDATSTPTAEAGDLESFRQFAAEIEAAVAAQDADFFVSHAEVVTTVCPNEFEPRCQDQPDGASIEGIPIGLWRSEGSLITVDEFRQHLIDYFSSVPDAALFAIAGLTQNVGGLIGGPVQFAIVSGSGDPPDVRIFEFVPSEGEWRLQLTLVGGVVGEEWLVGDCADCYDEWERWQGGAP